MYFFDDDSINKDVREILQAMHLQEHAKVTSMRKRIAFFQKQLVGETCPKKLKALETVIEHLREDIAKEIAKAPATGTMARPERKSQPVPVTGDLSAEGALDVLRVFDGDSCCKPEQTSFDYLYSSTYDTVFR
jgi:hypothetical protein